MDENYPETCKDTFEILIDLGFEIENPDGDIHIVRYDSKIGQENLFLECVSEFVVSSTKGLKPYIIWRGEDSATWKEVYGDKEVRVYDGTVVYLGEDDE
jgi:Fe-S oxidoreductase